MVAIEGGEVRETRGNGRRRWMRAEEALEVGGGADMRAPAASEWEREEGERKLGRRRRGGLGCWAARERKGGGPRVGFGVR
jgi:hypothetical protein